MSTITKERVAEIIHAAGLEPCDYEAVFESIKTGEIVAMARIALASLEAEPYGYVHKAAYEQAGSCGLSNDHEAYSDSLSHIAVYTTPPATVFPRDLEEIIFTIVNAMADEKLRNDESELFSLARKYIEHAKSKLSAAMLQGAEPVTTAYKLRDAVETIRNSGIEIDAEKIFAERDALNAPDCWCRTCRPVTISDMRFVVCPECGNKRCPHANDHRNACTGSNEPGQDGSAYPAAPQQEAE
ncbi:hypothetical protein ACFH0L_004672 [Enterobacter kobei]